MKDQRVFTAAEADHIRRIRLRAAVFGIGIKRQVSPRPRPLYRDLLLMKLRIFHPERIPHEI